MNERNKAVSFSLIAVTAALFVVFIAVWVVLRPRGAAPPPSQPGLAKKAAGADELPAPGSQTYRAMVSAFSKGVAALESDAKERAETSLYRATRFVPEEPAAWANLGLLKIRKQDYKGAAADLERARSLAPESGAIERLLGLLEGLRGQFDAAIEHLRKAVKLDPRDIKSRFALAEEVERLGEPNSEAEALRVLDELAGLRPNNPEVLRNRARLAAKLDDHKKLEASVQALGALSKNWPDRARAIWEELNAETRKPDQSPASKSAVQRHLAFLRNMLVRTPEFRQALAELQLPTGTVGEPIETFLRLEPLRPTPAPVDLDFAWTVADLAANTTGKKRWNVLRASPMSSDGPLAIIAADGREVRRIDQKGAPALPFPGGDKAEPPSPHGLLLVDWNSDYRVDLVCAGAGGVRIFQQKDDGTFADVTAAAKLEPAALNLDAFGAWAADLEMDGDLDLIVAARSGKPAVLRNNGDGTFSNMPLFQEAPGVRDFAWADFDGDGDPDAALLDDRGALHFYRNDRAGQLRPRPGPEKAPAAVAITAADMDRDGRIELLALSKKGIVWRVSDQNEGQGWDMADLARPVINATDQGATEAGASDKTAAGPVTARLFAADLDNNGAIDLVAWNGRRVWSALFDEELSCAKQVTHAGTSAHEAADLNGDGRLDMLALSDDGRPLQMTGAGKKPYHWQVVRPRSAKTFGDGRINSFGLGGEVEVRAGLLAQKQVINGPSLHFGLGDRPACDVVRIVWPNGTVQAEFDAKADQPLNAAQRLKGSCPFLYAYDGKAVRFVTDFLWRSPLGLRINAQDTAGSPQTEDRVKIRGDQLAPRDGAYDVRITGELWETHYWDHVALLVVDHPTDTEVFVNERFSNPPPSLDVQATGPLLPIAHARDDHGRDVTELVSQRDGRYLDTFERGFYQGTAREHWVEIELGEDVPRDRPLCLVAYGWTHPTDSSINVAIGQGGRVRPHGIVLEVPDGSGGWTIAAPDLGFPAGKNKTMLIDLGGPAVAGQGPQASAPRRFRLRTNLEVYWDHLAVAVRRPEVALKTQRTALESAVLRFRGYSRMEQASESAPELPRYDVLGGTRQRWGDLIGFYTRFGDVRELLETVDDRYVIANAGDELALRFRAPGPPPAGWRRDFVMIGDGWNKDGDYNTAFSKTVLPLPSHQRPRYDAPLSALEDDPVFRLHSEDWIRYHSRYVAPSDFQRGAWPAAARAARKLELKP